MSESEDPIYRIICCKDQDYCLASRSDQIVFALTNPFDRYQYWIKDESHGATKKDPEGHPTFALINIATGKAINHREADHPLTMVHYNVNSCDKSALWTMSKDVVNGFGNIRRPDLLSNIWVSHMREVYDGHHVGLHVPGDPENLAFLWKIVKVFPSTCVPLFRPSQHTIKIICQAKQSHNLAIDHKDGSTVLLVLSNPKDKYQHWIKETACGIPVKDEEGQEAFALVNKATGKAIKHGFGHNYLVQVAQFNRNCMDPSLLWTKSHYVRNGFRQIRPQNNINMAFDLIDDVQLDCPLLGLSKVGTGTCQQWKIEDFE